MIEREGILFPDSDTHCSPSVLEKDHLTQCLTYIKNYRTAIDCGAHVGVWSVIMAKAFKNVISFEPDKENYQCLVENVKHLPNVRTVNAALGSRKIRGSLHAPVNPGNSGAGWVVPGEEFDILKLDDLRLTDVDYLKLDVEGCEPFVIDGAENLIKKYHPVILVEQKPITARYGLDFLEAGRILEEMGYELREKLNNDFIYV